ncbi:hypothetical protein D3C72_1454420 [compost metagenome]
MQPGRRIEQGTTAEEQAERAGGPQAQRQIAAQPYPLVFEVDLLDRTEARLPLAIERRQHPLVDPLPQLPTLGMEPLLGLGGGTGQLGQHQLAGEIAPSGRGQLIAVIAKGEQQLIVPEHADEGLPLATADNLGRLVQQLLSQRSPLGVTEIDHTHPSLSADHLSTN